MANSDLELLLKIKADGSQSAAEITKLRALFASEFGQMGTLGTGALKGINLELTSLARSVPLVGTPLAGITQSFLNMGVSATPEVRKLSKELEAAKSAVGKFEAEVTTKFDGKVTPAFLRLYNQLPQLGDRINSQTPRFKAAFDSLGGDASALLPKLEKTSEEFAQLEGKVASASGAVSAAGGGLAAMAAPIGIAAGAVVGFGVIAIASAAHVASFGDAIYKVERKTSFGAGALSVLNLAAKETGTSFGEVGTALTRFERNIVAAEGGNKKLSAAFKNLGIDATTAAKNPQEAFSKFLTVFNQLPEGADRAAIAIQLFGRSGANLIPLFDQIGGDFEAATERAKRLGVFLGEDAVQQAHNFEVSMRDMRASLEGLEIQIGQKTLPVIERFIEGLAHTAQGGQGAAGRIGSFVGTVLDGVGVVANDAAHTVSQASQIIGGAYDAIGTTMGQAYTINKNFVVGLKELATLDFSGFENNVKSTFNTLDKEEGDLLERTKARLKEFASGTIEALTGLNNRDLNLKDVPTPTGAKPLDPSTQTAPLVAPLPNQKNEEIDRAEALKNALAQAKTEEATATADAKRQYELRTISLQAETSKQIDAIKRRLNVETTSIAASRELAQADLKDLTGTTEEKKKRYDKAYKDVQDYDQKERDATAQTNRQIADLRARQQMQERDSAAAHRAAMQKISDDADKIRIDKIKALPLAESEKESRIAEIQNAGFDRRKIFLENERSLAGADTRLRGQYNDQLAALELERTATQVKQAEARRVANKKEFDDGVRLRELELQTQSEHLSRLTTNLRAEAENRTRTFRDAETQIFATEEAYYEAQIKLLTDRIADAMKRGNAQLQSELRERKALLEDKRDASRDAAKRTLGTPATLDAPAVAGTVDTKEQERNQQRAAALRSYYVNIADITRAGEAEETQAMAQGGASRLTIIQREFKSEREALKSRYKVEFDALSDRRKLLTIDAASSKKNADEIKAIDAIVLALAKKLGIDLKKLDDEQKRALDLADPSSRLSLFGDSFSQAFNRYNKALTDAGKHTNNFRASLFGMSATAKGVFEDLSKKAGNFQTMMGDAFGSIGNALGQTAEAFLVTGELSGKALAKMLVQTLAHLATESGIKALYETAAGYASAAVYEFDAAAKHFTAAGFYGTVAGISAGAALVGSAAFGLRDGGKQKNSNAAGGRALGYGHTAHSSASNQPTIINEARSGTGNQQVVILHPESMSAISILNYNVQHLGTQIGGLHSKLSSMRPGDVVTVAARDNPGAFGDGLNRALDLNHPIRSDIIKKTGSG